MNADLATTLASLLAAGHITWSKIEDRGTLKVTVSVPVAYLGDDPNNGYDATTAASRKAIESALAAHDLSFADAGIEDDGSGEYWIYRAA